jgi:hypothetical protein
MSANVCLFSTLLSYRQTEAISPFHASPPSTRGKAIDSCASPKIRDSALQPPSLEPKRVSLDPNITPPHRLSGWDDEQNWTQGCYPYIVGAKCAPPMIRKGQDNSCEIQTPLYLT